MKKNKSSKITEVKKDKEHERYEKGSKDFLQLIAEPGYKSFFKKKLKEKTTWVGFFTIIIPFIRNNYKEFLTEDIMQVGAIGLGALLIFLNEKRAK
jgi:hypothetical protein